MRSWVLVLCLCACGDVNKAPMDAPSPDAYQPDAPAACGANEMSCGGACANVMTSELHCGSCDTQCAPNSGCLSGTCTAKNISCNRVRQFDPNAAPGLYTNPNTGTTFYCDFTGGNTYFAMAFGQHNKAYTDYALMASTDFNDPNIRKAFIALYNFQGGLRNIDIGFNSDNCCFRPADAAGAAGDLLLGGAGHYLYPAKTASAATQCGGPYSDPLYRWFENAGGTFSPLPMPDDFWDTHPASIGIECSGTIFPGIFMKRRLGLD